jgi:transcriptional regulator with XRE-family HTH domain
MSTIQDNTEARLAARLRAERETRNWSIADLATRSGVSRAMISKVERNEASPTAALLGRLSAAFGLTMSQLFARIEQAGGLVARAADQPLWRDPETGFLRRSLSPPAGAPLELVWGEMPPGQGVAYPAESYRQLLDQQIVVLSGQLTIVHGGETHILHPGDCIRYGPPSDSIIRNDGTETARYIVAVLRRTP